MKENIVKYLACPECNGEIQISKPYKIDTYDEIKEGTINCQKCRLSWPIKGYIPRFVCEKNYSRSFGFQWNKHKTSQLDSITGLQISHDRFFNETKWPLNMRGSLILEAGCGAGRFTEIVLKTGAEVFSFDYSTAVDACLENNGLMNNLHIIQADIYNIPFKKELFDKIFCFGVLQHTPNVEKAFKSLTPFLKPGGSIIIDVYSKSPWLLWRVKYKLRPFTKVIPNNLLYLMLKLLVPFGIKLKTKLSKCNSILARKIGEAIPILNYKGVYSLSYKQLLDWAILDTFDMFSPKYDQPQDIEDVREWFKKANLSKSEVEFGGNGIVGRGVKVEARKTISKE